MSINIDEVPQSESKMDQRQDTNYLDARGVDYLPNNQNDSKLDKDVLDTELCLENINEMIKAKLPIVQFMDS